MKVGTAQLNITPEPGIELAGFAIRPQPSTRILDPLWLRALYLEDGQERLLWLHADLLALDQALADRWRVWVETNLRIPRACVVLSTTHTHSAPAAIQLTGCGQVQPKYVAWLETQFHEAACAAQRQTEPCVLRRGQSTCRLGSDRRGTKSPHVDSRVGVFGWQRRDGTFKAAFLSYAMHPVCLRSSLISADWPGVAAEALSEALPGRPVTLVSSSACGDINPPGVGVTPAQMRDWGREIGSGAASKLLEAARDPHPQETPALRVLSTQVNLPLEPWDAADVHRYADACLADTAGSREFPDKFRQAVEGWRISMNDRLRRKEPSCTRAELTVIKFGQAAVVTANAEVFSRFTELAGRGSTGQVYTVNCANGMIGYLPTAEAYEEGGYEVNWSMLFYNVPRPQRGALEQLAQRAHALLTDH